MGILFALIPVYYSILPPAAIHVTVFSISWPTPFADFLYF